MSRELFTSEVAADLRIPAHMVRKLIRQGHLKARRKYPQGRRWLVTEQAVADYRRACSQ